MIDHTVTEPHIIPVAASQIAVPAAYVLHFSITTCSGCGTTTRNSQFYALTFLKARFTNTLARQLTPCTRPLYNLPVERVMTGHRTTPYCAECPTIDLSSLPNPQENTRNLNNVNSAPTIVRNTPSASPFAAKPRATAKPTPTKATLGDLA